MSRLEELISQAQTIAILGHVNPDGDCIGSSLGLYNYIKKHDPARAVTVYMEKCPEKFSYLKGFDQVCHELPEDMAVDLLICLDSSDSLMLGIFGEFLKHAKRNVCVDHHVTNVAYGQENIVMPRASSTCEVLYSQLNEDEISKDVAECLYTGIVTDSGVFKYDNASSHTMNVAGKLMDKGVDFGRIIDEAFFRKSYLQTQIMGRALLESVVFMGGKCVFSVVRKKDMDFYGVEKHELDGIVEQLRLIDGVEVSIFLHEVDTYVYKVSMRSKYYVDVSKIAKLFGGGGHKKASGCTMTGTVQDVVNNLSAQIEIQMVQHEKELAPQENENA